MAKSNSPRIDVEISAITTDLIKGLSEARAELRKFNDDVTKGAKPDFKNALQAEKLAAAELRTEAQRARTAIAQLALEKRKSAQATQAASGSYREAQQRLTALGRSIREAQGGFTSANPVIREQIREYNSLNNKLKEFDRQMGNNYRNVGNYTSALSGIAPNLARLGTGVGIAAAALAGVNYALRTGKETLFAFDTGMKGVEKTTGLSRKETEKLGKSFVDMSRQLEVVSPVKLTEYATAAGQLGVKGTHNIGNFTEALAKLETASNIKGEEGASDIARFLTLVDGGVRRVKDFSDEIVHLGNNFPATEKEILKNSLAVSQNSAQYDIGRRMALAYGTATISSGIEAEVAGSKIGKALRVLESSILTGANLDRVMKLTGLSAKELGEQFRKNSGDVLYKFIRGLNEIDKSGGSVTMTLTELGLKEERLSRVLGTLATKGFGTLTEAINKAKDAAGAADNEFKVQADSLENQTGKVRIAWDNLVLSIDSGNGALSTFSKGASTVLADLLNGLAKVSDRAITTNNAFSAMTATGASGMSLSNLKGLNDSLKEPIARGESPYLNSIINSTSKWLDLNKENVSITESIAEHQAKQSAIASEILKKETVISSVKSKSKGAKGKTQSELIKEANEALQSGQIGALRGIDNVMGKIDEKWNKINEKINKIADVGLRKQQLELSKLGREQEKYNKFLDIYAKQSEKLTRGGLPARLSGTISSPSSLPGLGRAQERIGIPRISKGLTDEFTKQFKSTLRRGLASTFDSFFSDLTTLSESNYEIEKKYADLRANATASQIAGLQKMEALEKKINNGLTNMLSKIGSTFTGIAGNLLSSALSTGISSGSFKDLKNMFTGDSKAIGYGALGSLAGGALGGVLKPSDVVGQGLSGALAGAGSGVAIGTMIGGPLGTILGGVGGAIIGGISSIFGSSKRKREEELLRLQLAEQKKIAVATERQNMLTYASQVIGQMTNQGVVTSVERDALGGLVANIKGSDIQLVLDRYNNSRN